MEVGTNYLKRSQTSSQESEDPEVPWTEHFRRQEQNTIGSIMKGEEHGHVYVLLGPKGSGKGTMIFDSMNAVQADGIAMCEAHPDLEVFRLRLGKALNYESMKILILGCSKGAIRAKRSSRTFCRLGGPALDIERGRLEMRETKRQTAGFDHQQRAFFKNDEDGCNILLQLHQRAESWAACGIMTIVFNMDDFWPFYVMHVSAKAVTAMRMEMKHKIEDPSEIEEAVSIVGGRLSYLNKIARSKNVKEMADRLLRQEQAWLLSQIGLIVDCDDDVMDEQKWSSCSWLLLQGFVKLRQEQEKECPEADHSALPLPVIPYQKCRQIMTRTDFLKGRISLPLTRTMTRLDSVRDRIDEIESLHRTRELTFKDLEKGDKIRLVVDKGVAELLERRAAHSVYSDAWSGYVKTDSFLVGSSLGIYLHYAENKNREQSMRKESDDEVQK
ncbi:hypothetical protein VNI00_015488 [Paramarasmius palmivorus]|uniref:AAA protein C-terminal winged helix domain-containing protein n=1 Tax=Paramarasmius palmivorus TaxID=297713 RepID=A0AAW0BKU7_9AGAR